jgi:hypothetical protein
MKLVVLVVLVQAICGDPGAGRQRLLPFTLCHHGSKRLRLVHAKSVFVCDHARRCEQGLFSYHSSDSSGDGLMATTLPTTPVISRVSQDERERTQYVSWQASLKCSGRRRQWNCVNGVRWEDSIPTAIQYTIQSIGRTVSSPSIVASAMHEAFVHSCVGHYNACSFPLDSECLSSLSPSMGTWEQFSLHIG